MPAVMEQVKESIFVRVLKGMMEETHPPVTQADLAFTLDASAQYVCDVMKGRRHPFSPEDLVKLSKVYGFNLQLLLTARAWVMRKVDIPPFASFRTVEKTIQDLMKKQKASMKTWTDEQEYEPIRPDVLIEWLGTELRHWLQDKPPQEKARYLREITQQLQEVTYG